MMNKDHNVQKTQEIIQKSNEVLNSSNGTFQLGGSD
jgi:hypothetical protein